MLIDYAHLKVFTPTQIFPSNSRRVCRCLQRIHSDSEGKASCSGQGFEGQSLNCIGFKFGNMLGSLSCQQLFCSLFQSLVLVKKTKRIFCPKHPSWASLIIQMLFDL